MANWDENRLAALHEAIDEAIDWSFVRWPVDGEEPTGRMEAAAVRILVHGPDHIEVMAGERSRGVWLREELEELVRRDE
jgi:hypothetical protein